MKKTLTTLFAVAMLALPSSAFALSEREGLDIYQRGLYLEAIEYWKKAAAAGDAGSAYRLSEEYFDAKIVKRDLKLALQYLKQAADGNDARALTDLASMFDYGTGVKEDRKRAAELYLRAARMGMPAAMFNVASMLETGEGIEIKLVDRLQRVYLMRLFVTYYTKQHRRSPHCVSIALWYSIKLVKFPPRLHVRTEK